MAKQPSSDSVKSYSVGLNKGYTVTKVTRTAQKQTNGKASDKNREIRALMRSVTGLTPLEKRTLELFKSGVAQVEKRAFKLLRKRYGTRKRAIRKRDQLQQIIKNLAKKKDD